MEVNGVLTASDDVIQQRALALHSLRPSTWPSVIVQLIHVAGSDLWDCTRTQFRSSEKATKQGHAWRIYRHVSQSEWRMRYRLSDSGVDFEASRTRDATCQRCTTDKSGIQNDENNPDSLREETLLRFQQISVILDQLSKTVQTVIIPYN